ncbi:MAG: flagellar biosynthesis protein FlgA [Pseudomonadota bacterium]
MLRVADNIPTGIAMQFEQLLLSATERPVRVALIGTGEFGLSLISQARHINGMDVVVAVDPDLNRVGSSLTALDVDHRHCQSRQQALTTIEAGELALLGSADDVFDLPVEMIVEATGSPQAGALHALRAIESGIGVTMVSKEAECLVGPILAHKARQAGVPYTLVEGDQPALLISLISRARALGLPVVCVGKSSEYDFVFDPADGTTTWTTETTGSPQLAEYWSLSDNVPAVLDARSQALSELPQRTVPDFCEMLLVSNATGILPDRPDFHAPMTRAVELPSIYIPQSDGGLLESTPSIDVFNCLRRPDEASFAGGVFVVVEWADTTSGALFRGKGIPTSPDGKYGLIYNPSHLLGVEAPMSIMAAARLGNASVNDSYHPVVDLTARAATDIAAGRVLDIVGTRHAIPDLEPLLTPAQGVSDTAPLPYYMAVGARLGKPVKAGEFITRGHLASPLPASLNALRAEQDALFS